MLKYWFFPIDAKFFSFTPKESSHFAPGSSALAIGNHKSPIPTVAQINLLSIFYPSDRLLLPEAALPGHDSGEPTRAGVYPVTPDFRAFFVARWHKFCESHC